MLIIRHGVLPNRRLRSNPQNLNLGNTSAGTGKAKTSPTWAAKHPPPASLEEAKA
jgi:hypothetical protein